MVPPLKAWKERWPNFSPGEVLSPAGHALYSQKGLLVIQPHAMDFLQSFRNQIGKRFFINGGHTGSLYRGYRDCWENKRAGGVDHSYHLQGLAFDVSIEDTSPERVFELAKEFGWKGIGLYETFVHMDLRPRLDGDVVTWMRD
jgi:hypothetical protein